jgi:hypothetical protein
MDVIGNQEFLQLDPTTFTNLLSSDELNVPNEEDVVNVISPKYIFCTFNNYC